MRDEKPLQFVTQSNTNNNYFQFVNQANTFENQDYISFQRALYQDILSNQMNKKEIIEIDDDSDDEVEICDVNMQNKNLPSNRPSI